MLVTLSEETEYYIGNLRFKLTKHGIAHVIYPTPNGGAPALADMDTCTPSLYASASVFDIYSIGRK